MKTVAQLLQGSKQQLVVVAPSDTVRHALTEMARMNVGALLVMEGEMLRGIFSERDYARKGILQGKHSADTMVSEIMSSKVISVRSQQTIDECMQIMTDKRIRHLPVVDDERVVGIISIGDVVKESISHLKFVIAELESYIAG